LGIGPHSSFLHLIIVRQSLAVMLATANYFYFCSLLADIYLFTLEMRKADMIDSERV